MAKQNKPAIRFKGFTDAWEQRKLSELLYLSSERNNGSYTRDDVLAASLGTELQKKHIYFGLRATDESVKNYKVVLPNDVIYTKSPIKGFPNGIIRTSKGENGIVPTLYCVYHSVDVINPSIIQAYFESKERLDAYLVPLVNIGARNNVNITDKKFLDGSLCIPKDKAEQDKIVDVLERLSNLITLHQRKYDKLQVLKKAMLEKMFPKNGGSVPEIRFKGFTDAWEQRKLGEVATFINGRAYSQPELLSSGKYKVLRVGNFYTNDSWYYSDLELGEKYYADYGDLLYTWSATFGPHIWLGDRVIYHYHIWKINLSDQLEKQFAVQLLEQDRTNILSSKNGSTMVHITKEGMEQKDVIIPPSTKEQQEIGAFFLQLDNLITLHQRELEKLQNIKKSMLEKMFV